MSAGTLTKKLVLDTPQGVKVGALSCGKEFTWMGSLGHMCEVFLQCVEVGVSSGSLCVGSLYHTGHMCEVFFQCVEIGAVSGSLCV